VNGATLRPMVWEFVFLMVILKIPVIYLCAVVYWAIKGGRDPVEPARLVAAPDIDPRPPWSPRRPRPRPGPHGSPRRREARVGRDAPARA
jgi:hypothetical protein